MNNSFSSIDTEWSTDQVTRSRPNGLSESGRTASASSWPGTRSTQLPRTVEEGIIYRMFRQKGATHEEAYKRQQICTAQRNEMKKLASADKHDGPTSKEMEKNGRKEPKRTGHSAASA